MSNKLYADRDIMDNRLSEIYCIHVQAMTEEGLHSKSDIAAELAWRDLHINDFSDKVEQLERERNELATQVDRLQKIPYTKTRAEFMESWGVDGMSADKKRLANAAWDRAEWFFNQQVDSLKAQWQAEALIEIAGEFMHHERARFVLNWKAGKLLQRTQKTGNE